MATALILVDFENEWLDENSEYYVGDITAILEQTNRLIDHARKEGYKIIFTRHVEEDGDVFQAGTKNCELISDLKYEENDTVITKHRISPFYNTNLEGALKGIDHIVTCGILTNLCVRSLVQDAYDRDFDITVITDCCVAFDQETQDFTFRDLKATREEVSFVSLEEFVGVPTGN
ncbi:MAG: cysteine hydrolase family protein [Nanobdellota archaeon]